MRIGIVTAHLSESAGGFSASIPGLVRSLAAAGNVDCHIIGVRDSSRPDAWRRWGANVHPLDGFGPPAFGFAPGYAEALHAVAPDLVDAQGLWMYPSWASLRYSRRMRRPHIVTPRGMLDPWSLGRSSMKKRLATRLFEGDHLRLAACLRATAPLEADHFRRYGLTNPIAIIPNGIDLPTLEPRSDRDTRNRRMLFLSRVHPKKGIDHLLRAWARVHHRVLDWELVIAGPDEGGHRAEMQRLADQLELPNVLWLNAVHGQQKLELYRSADVFVLPTHAENFGLVVAEALAHEVPVITTRNAPWDGLERHRCGWWIELSDVALVAALDEALSLSDADRRAMGERGRAWVARDFAWSAIAGQMHEVYTWVLGGDPPPACVMTD